MFHIFFHLFLSTHLHHHLWSDGRVPALDWTMFLNALCHPVFHWWFGEINIKCEFSFWGKVSQCNPGVAANSRTPCLTCQVLPLQVCSASLTIVIQDCHVGLVSCLLLTITDGILLCTDLAPQQDCGTAHRRHKREKLLTQLPAPSLCSSFLMSHSCFSYGISQD